MTTRDWDEPITILGRKWHQVPASLQHRESTRDLLSLPDNEFLQCWERLRTGLIGSRGLYLTHWPLEMYRDFVRNKKIIEVGPGLGVQGVWFLECGAEVTFVDVSPSNLIMIGRICDLKGLTGATFLALKEFSDIELLAADYDAVFAGGSLHHAPAAVTKTEFRMLASRLKLGGRFIIATYPKSRWEADGSPLFKD